MTPFEKTFHWMKKPHLIVPYAILVVLAYIYVDRFLASYFYHLDLRTKIYALSILTTLGKWTAYVILFFIAAVYFRFIRVNSVYEARSWYLMACVLVANLLCLALKISLGRARPELLFTSNEFGFYGFKLMRSYWSFPSGHTTTVVSLAVGLGVLFPRYFYAALAAALLIAVSRVLLYHHYLSDVLTGFYLSLLVTGFFTCLLQERSSLLKQARVKDR